MSYPNSVEEIDDGMLAEGFDAIPEAEQDFILSVMRDERQAEKMVRDQYRCMADSIQDVLSMAYGSYMVDCMILA